MPDRKKRLAQLVAVQRKLKAVHEMRHAAHLAGSAAARQEAEDILARAGEAGALTDLFPDLVARSVGRALAREEAHRLEAGREAEKVVAWSVRSDTTERARRDAARDLERRAEEKDRQEAIGRKKG